MRRRASWLVSSLCFLSFASLGVAAEELDAKAIVAKAYAAVGGEKAAKPMGATWKEEGTYYGMGDGLPYTSTCAMQLPGRFRMEITGFYTIVVDGDKGWAGAGGGTAEMSKEQLEAQKQMLYAMRVMGVAPLANEKGFQVTLAAEEKVNDRPAYALKIAHDKHKDITLYIDKENFLVVKSAQRVQSEELNKEVDQEDFYSDYKEFDGRKHPMTIAIHRDGKKFVEAKVSDYKPAEKLDEKLFEKP